MRENPLLWLIDGSGLFHRAYFAVRHLSTRRGLPTGAVFGFTSMMRKLLQDETPELLAVAFDLPGPTFRHELYPEYKAQRPKMDEELVVQIPYIRRVCEALRLSVVEAEGFEADDVIATLVCQARAAGLGVRIVSSDKDLLQLVADDVQVVSPGRDGGESTLYDAQAVEQRWGVPPQKIGDVLALMGDSSDNVPGVAGIGEKGARDLIREFGSLDNLLANAGQVKRNAYRNGLIEHKDDALLSRRLVTLREDAPVALAPQALGRQDPDRVAAQALFKELEFTSLAKEYAPTADPTATPVEALTDMAELRALVRSSQAVQQVALALTPGAGADPSVAALAWAAGQVVDLTLEGEDAALAIVRPWLESSEIAKVCSDSKSCRIWCARHRIALAGVTLDATLAAYLLDPGRRSYAIEQLSQDLTGEAVAPLALATPRDRARQEALLTLGLAEPLAQQLTSLGLKEIHDTLELPLARVLAEMESVGIKLDLALLHALSAELETRLASLVQEIEMLAGQSFNVNSPVQLRQILFEKLGLKSVKKTAKTRSASTAEDALEELATQHALPAKILEYRALQKLKSTYVDALPALARPETGRVHTCLNQTIAATGRLSSTEPNLQNIPIRTAEGRRIRQAFVADVGCLLISADYSQIELRMLAHLSRDETLIDTFRRGEDVHDRTAREVFGPFSPLPPDEQRRRAKMINYALLYGKTSFTLAKDLGIARREAEAFIESYFSRYPKVRRFIEETLVEARQTELVRTILGRIRRLPDLKARNGMLRAEAERQAVNAVIQGSAADLIKKAMLDLDRELKARRSKARLLLQIHDELLLEAPEEEVEDAARLVQETMQSALALAVPLVADTHSGKNWAEAHV